MTELSFLGWAISWKGTRWSGLNTFSFIISDCQDCETVKVISAVCYLRFWSSVHWDETVLWVELLTDRRWVRLRNIWQIESCSLSTSSRADKERDRQRSTGVCDRGCPKHWHSVRPWGGYITSSVTHATLLPMAFYKPSCFGHVPQ